MSKKKYLKASPKGYTYKRIGEWLVEQNLLTEAQRDEVLETQKEEMYCKRFGEIAIEKNFLSEDAFYITLAKKLRVPYSNLRETEIDSEAAHRIPLSLIRKYQVIAIKLCGRRLTVATADPINFNILEDIKMTTELDTVPVMASPSAIRETINRICSDGQEFAKEPKWWSKSAFPLEKYMQYLALENPVAMPEEEPKKFLGKVKQKLTSFFDFA
ncbi:MAG: hypothetical protein IJ644_02945 [Oscillospiraceae bacterium]|nr:hypothetical protein [Oscillospiraceae bacterium]